MKRKNVLQHLKRLFVKRKYKDLLFKYVFRDKKDILDLYNAINNTNYTNPDDLTITTMEDIIYIGMKNDLSFLVANDMNLYEHQSTINKNMPLRGLFYFARMYEGYVEMNGLDRYQRERLKLPFPRYVVFYNGEEEMPECMEFRLSESFGDRGEEPAIECIAKVLNINYGKNRELMEKCRRLKEYAYYIGKIRDYLHKGYDMNVAVERATEDCIQEGVLEDMLRKHRAEVASKFLTTFNQKDYEKSLKREAREVGYAEGKEKGFADGKEEGREEGRKEGRKEGREEGRKEGMEDGLLALVETCQELGLSKKQTVEKIAEKFHMTLSEAEEKVQKYWK